jgi:3-hydroxyacyl-CoA dehydrogenase / enoyl-CoA hydratase / 3-hydroxybutyryl-CoA epimerase
MGEAAGGAPPRQRRHPLKSIQEWVLFAEALETSRASTRAPLAWTAPANGGSILGIEFPAWSGGAVQYRGGARFVARQLASPYGAPFEPPATLVPRAEQPAPA